MNWDVVIQAVKCGTTSRDPDRCFAGLDLELFASLKHCAIQVLIVQVYENIFVDICHNI